MWEKEWPFGAEVGVDGDNPQHLQWIFERALSRAKSYNITGVTYRLTQGVVKRIIPAVASTNAVIAGLCCNEVVKLLTGIYKGSTLLNFEESFMNFNQIEGVYSFAFPTERKENCSACSNKPVPLELSSKSTVAEFLEQLKQKFDLENPSVTAAKSDGAAITIFIPIIEHTHENLKLPLKDFANSSNVFQVAVADKKLAKTLQCVISFI